jgi:uncharacterized membrane protein
MADSYKVIVNGELQPDAEPELAVAAFSTRFGTPEHKVRQLLGANRDVTLKAGLELAEAERYREVLERMGFAVRLDAEQPAASAQELALEPMPEPRSEPQPEPEPQSSAGDSNPFATPQADLDDREQEGEIHDPVSVPAGNGWRWLSDGFQLFKRNPVAWIGALVVWVALSMALSLIPLINLVVSLFSAVIGGGFMLGARAQDEGGDFRVGHLFAGFSNNFGSLLLLGLFYLVGMFVIGIVMAFAIGGSVFMAGAAGNPDPAAMQSVMTGPGVLIPVLIGVVLITALIMAYWFAPALVALEGVSPLSAMALSFKACMKNVLPFLVYGIAAMGLVLVGMLPFLLGLLVVIPMITASIYTGYRDIFYS